MQINADKGDYAMLFFMLNPGAVAAIVIIVIAAAAVLATLYIKKFKKVTLIEDLKDSPKKDILLGLRDNAEKFGDYYEPLFILAAGNAARKNWVFDNWNNTVNAIEGNEAFKKAFRDEFGALNSDPACVPHEEFPIIAIPAGASKKDIKNIKKKNKAVTKKAKMAAKKAKKEAKRDTKLAKNPKKAEKFAAKELKASNKLYIEKAYKLIKYLKKAGICRDIDENVIADETTAEKYDVIGTTSLVAGNMYDVYIPYWALTKKTRIFNTPEEAPVMKEVPLSEMPVTEEAVTEAFEETVTEEAAAAPEFVQPVPGQQISKRKAKKLAKKQKKADKKAAKKQKKLDKKIRKANKKAGIVTPETAEKAEKQPEFTIEETIILVAKGAIR